MARPTIRLRRATGRPFAAPVAVAIAAVLATLLAIAPVGWTARTVAAGTALSRWTGGVDLYRPGTFTTQRSWLWCTAADVQIARNIVERQRDHSTDAQRGYF